MGEKQTEDLIKQLEDAEAVELDDKDLDAVSGGAGDCNCSCGAEDEFSSSGDPGSARGDTNCCC